MKTICFITRCHPARPRMLETCMNSIRKQTCGDYNHLLLKDPTSEGYGIDAANKAIQELADVNGEFAMVLDDDDMLMYDGFVQDFVGMVKNKPDVVIFRGIVRGKGTLPPDEYWEKPPVRGKIGSFCFAVSREYWQIYHNYWRPSEGYQKMCDYTFIDVCYRNAEKIMWIDKIVACTQFGANNGRSECQIAQS